MQAAINEAQIAYNKNEVPIGSVISDLNVTLFMLTIGIIFNSNCSCRNLAIRSA